MVNNPVLKTLLYESIFSFPLSKDEIWKFLINDKRIARDKFDSLFLDKSIRLDRKSGFYYLSGKKETVARRAAASSISFKKQKLAADAARELINIPTIEFIGVSGSLALNGAKASDDIDLFIICQNRTIWTTRLFAVLFLKLKGVYWNNKDFKDKICLNMLADQYSFLPNRRDLYNAFEITKLKPLLQRNNSYRKFILRNIWIKNFMSNATEVCLQAEPENKKSQQFLKLFFDFLQTFHFERLAKFIQLVYMKQRTNETISDHLLAFHPRDFRREIMTAYNMLIGSTRGY